MSDKRRLDEHASDRAALARPQPFPLTGDGAAMEGIFCRENHMLLHPRCGLAEAVAQARYRDWLAGRRQAQ